MPKVTIDSVSRVMEVIVDGVIVKKRHCTVKLNNGAECGALMGTVPFTIQRHCQRKHGITFSTTQDNGDGRHTNRDDHLEECAQITIMAHLPLSHWNNPIVKKNQQRCAAGYDVKLSDRVIKTKISAMYEALVERHRLALGNRMFCLKFDLATRKDRHILGVSVQYVDEWKLVVRHIAMTAVVKAQTALVIKDEIKEILEGIEINKNLIYTTTTDNGANVLKASKLLLDEIEWDLSRKRSDGVWSDCDDESMDVDEGEDSDEDEEIVEGIIADGTIADGDIEGGDSELVLQLSETQSTASMSSFNDDPEITTGFSNDLHCAAHTVQLGVNDFLRRYESTINKIKVTVKKLRKAFDAIALDIRPPKPTLANITRWSSTYTMVSLDL